MSSFEQLHQTTKVHAGERKYKMEEEAGTRKRETACLVNPSICDEPISLWEENTFLRTKQNHDWNLEIYKIQREAPSELNYHLITPFRNNLFRFHGPMTQNRENRLMTYFYPCLPLVHVVFIYLAHP